MRTLLRLSVSCMLLSALFALRTPAFAHGGSESQGQCSQHSTFKLDLNIEDQNLQTTFEVDQGINGHRWAIRITDNGTTIFQAMRVTDDGGSFKVEKTSANLDGVDTVIARARDVSTGETCKATASI